MHISGGVPLKGWKAVKPPATQSEWSVQSLFYSPRRKLGDEEDTLKDLNVREKQQKARHSDSLFSSYVIVRCLVPTLQIFYHFLILIFFKHIHGPKGPKTEENGNHQTKRLGGKCMSYCGLVLHCQTYLPLLQ